MALPKLHISMKYTSVFTHTYIIPKLHTVQVYYIRTAGLTLLFVSVFLTVPSPPVLIVTVEERHVYMCNHSETINVFWRVNGSILMVDIFPSEINSVILTLPGGGRVLVVLNTMLQLFNVQPGSVMDL